MMRTMLVSAALLLTVMGNASAIDCFKETGTFTGGGSQYSNVDPEEAYDVEVTIGPNSYAYSRTYAANLKESGKLEFICHEDGTMEWVGVANGRGKWGVSGEYELDGQGANYRSVVSLSVQNGRTYLIMRNVFDDGIIVRYGEYGRK
ncbi:MAG: hypothetical protein AB7T49_10710 [Oligoflexales bacterium]